MQRATRQVREGYIDGRRNIDRLVALQGQRERDVAATIACRRLGERLVKILEMYYC